MNEPTRIKLKTIDGQVVETQIGNAANVGSFFVFSLHKAGSSLLNKMMQMVCTHLSIPTFEPEMVEYNNGLALETLGPEVQAHFHARGFCYSNFRSYPRYMDGFDISTFKKVLLIRDPRDILVSHYFSHKISHHIPPGELGESMLQFREKLAAISIDAYALKMAAPLKSKFERYEKSIFDSNMKLFRYEDVIFEKQQWLERMLEHFGLRLDRETIDSIVAEVDHRPTVEDTSKHIRKVTPGDHLEKLQPETIAELNQMFADILKTYGYSCKTLQIQSTA